MKYNSSGSLYRTLHLFLAVLITVMTIHSAYVYAETEEGNRWGSAADQIDQYLDTAFEYYLDGDAKNAYDCVNICGMDCHYRYQNRQKQVECSV